MNNNFAFKKIPLFALTLMAMVGLYWFFVYNNPTNKSMPIISSHGNYVSYNSVDDMINASELILVGKPTKDFLNRKHKVTYTKEGYIEDAYTLTELQVHKILKSPTDFSLQKSKTIEIIEPVSITESFGGKQKLTIEDYQELTKGNNFIVFLKKNTYGNYCVINMEKGKFNLDSTEPSEEKDAIKSQFKKEIINKYNDWASPVKIDTGNG